MKQNQIKNGGKNHLLFGDIATIIAAAIAILVTILDLFDLLEVGWFDENLAKITLLLVSLVVISDVVERQYLVSSLNNKLNEKPEATLESTESFANGVGNLIGHNQIHTTMDILGTTSTLYYYAFRDSASRVDTVRLLLRSTSNLDELSTPSIDIAKQEFASESAKMIRSWKELHIQGRISELEIRYFSFDTLMHFMVVDGTLCHFGLYQPKHDIPGPDVLNTFILDNNSASGNKFVKDLRIEFDTIWNSFSDIEENVDAD